MCVCVCAAVEVVARCCLTSWVGYVLDQLHALAAAEHILSVYAN